MKIYKEGSKPTGDECLMIYNDESCFFGTFRGNATKCEGIMIYPNKDVYTGSWDNRKYDSGILRKANGSAENW